MIIGFISYDFGEHYHWVCSSWEEMYNYCKDDLNIIIPEKEPIDIEDKSYYHQNKDSSWISLGKASEYSLKQAKLC